VRRHNGSKASDMEPDDSVERARSILIDEVSRIPRRFFPAS
jgi:hypothetical protein